MCGCALSVMLLTLAVVLLTLHDYSGTFQGGYSARFAGILGEDCSSYEYRSKEGPIAYFSTHQEHTAYVRMYVRS